MALRNAVRMLIVGIMFATGATGADDVIDGADAAEKFVADAPEGAEGPPPSALDKAAGTVADAFSPPAGAAACFVATECATSCLNGTKCVACSESDSVGLMECASVGTEEGEAQAPLAPKTTCRTVTPTETDPLGNACYENVTWAMETGLAAKPEYYVNYSLTPTSSFDDFQCALHKMAGADEIGMGHDCPLPCGSSLLAKHTGLPECAVPESETPTTVVTTTTEPSSSSSFPWWAWLLLGLLCAIGGVAYVFMGKEATPKKKKRTTKTVAKKAEPELVKAPETPAPPAVPVLVAPPVYVTTPQYAASPAPVQTYAAPITTYAAAPAAAPVQTMAPATYAAAPATMQYAAAPATMQYAAAPATMPYAAPQAYSATVPAGYGSAVVPQPTLS